MSDLDLKISSSPIDHKLIDRDALEIVKRLQKAGHTTYFVGGCVRDLLIQIPPKDFDIATTARPSQVRRLIPYAYVIGRRFRLVLVHRNDKQFEVATFRRTVNISDESENLTPALTSKLSEAEVSSTEGLEAQRDYDQNNIYGLPEEDAERRDFTLNSIFFDPIKNRLIDYCGGIADIKAQRVRMIGDPDLRLIEDPIRILRAIRLAHKCRFGLDEKLRDAMSRHSTTIAQAALPRRREEILKILKLRDPELALRECFDLGVLKYLIPTVAEIYQNESIHQTFERYLAFLPDCLGPESPPVYCFGIFLLAYLRSLEPDRSKTSELLKELESEKCLQMVRHELSVFKNEFHLIRKALHLFEILNRVDDFKKWGHRRAQAVLANECTPLALLLAEIDCTLEAPQLQFWKQALKHFYLHDSVIS